mgnify:FL=1
MTSLCGNSPPRAARLLSLLLCVLLALGCAACVGTTDDASSTASETSGNVSDGPAQDDYHDGSGKYWPTYSDALSEEIIGDRTEVRVLVYSNKIQTTYFSEEIEPGLYSTTDAKLTEAVTERNNLISEKLGITVRAVPVDDVSATLRQEILAPTGEFDIAMPFLSDCATLAQEDTFYDLKDFEAEGIIDLSAPWYDQNANDSLSIQNKVYFTVSDMSIMQKIVSSAILYNTELIESKMPNLDLFQLVLDKEWTLDKMQEIGRTFASDLDGDGVRNSKDMWGAVTSNGTALNFYFGAGEMLCTKDENDVPIIAIGEGRSIRVSQKILETLQEKDWVIRAESLRDEGSTDIWMDNLAIFGEGRSAFCTMTFSAVKKLRVYDIDYAILPLPLVDDTQTEYYTPCAAYSAYGAVVSTSLNAEDARFAAYMIDVLSAGGKQYIATAYYDQILKNKDALSDSSKEIDILDLIFENVVYDVGVIYGFQGLNSLHTNLMIAGSTDIASALESVRSQVTEKINQIVEQYSK